MGYEDDDFENNLENKKEGIKFIVGKFLAKFIFGPVIKQIFEKKGRDLTAGEHIKSKTDAVNHLISDVRKYIDDNVIKPLTSNKSSFGVSGIQACVSNFLSGLKEKVLKANETLYSYANSLKNKVAGGGKDITSKIDKFGKEQYENINSHIGSLKNKIEGGEKEISGKIDNLSKVQSKKINSYIDNAWKPIAKEAEKLFEGIGNLFRSRPEK